MASVVKKILRKVRVIPTVSNGAAYATLDAVGGLNTITGFFSSFNQMATLLSVKIHDKDGQAANLVINFFNAAVTVAADNAAYSISDADELASGLGWTALAAGDHVPTGAGGRYELAITGVRPVVWASATSLNLYCQLKNVTTTPTYTSTTALAIDLIFELDP